MKVGLIIAYTQQRLTHSILIVCGDGEIIGPVCIQTAEIQPGRIIRHLDAIIQFVRRNAITDDITICTIDRIPGKATLTGIHHVPFDIHEQYSSGLFPVPFSKDTYLAQGYVRGNCVGLILPPDITCLKRSFELNVVMRGIRFLFALVRYDIPVLSVPRCTEHIGLMDIGCKPLLTGSVFIVVYLDGMYLAGIQQIHLDPLFLVGSSNPSGTGILILHVLHPEIVFDGRSADRLAEREQHPVRTPLPPSSEGRYIG